jgi:heat shock 70kDa protein 1/2/6/8
LVYDLGGGTFDISIIKIKDGSSFDVLAVAGDDHLGGEDFDNRLVNHFAIEFQRQHKTDLRNNQKSLQRLRLACERAKRTLSSTSEATIDIDTLYDGKDFCAFITRGRFELLCMDLFASTIIPVEQALRDACLSKNQINEIVMVGGSTRIPKIQKLLSDFFDEKKINFTINPDEAVAYGAAVQAAILTNVYCSHIQSIQLFDILPLSLGIATGMEKFMSKIIQKQSKIPCKGTKFFVTKFDNQTEMEISVFEGDRKMTADNNFIGEFILKNLTSAPRGLTEAIVTFDLNADGILEVTAKEVGTENMQKIQIDRNNSNLTKSDVDRMLADAIKYKEIDKKHSERISARRELDDYILKHERAIADKNKDKEIAYFQKNKIKVRCSKELKWLNDSVNAKKEILEQRLQQLKQYFDGLKIDI